MLPLGVSIPWLTEYRENPETSASVPCVSPLYMVTPRWPTGGSLTCVCRAARSCVHNLARVRSGNRLCEGLQSALGEAVYSAVAALVCVRKAYTAMRASSPPLAALLCITDSALNSALGVIRGQTQRACNSARDPHRGFPELPDIRSAWLRKLSSRQTAARFEEVGFLCSL